MPSGFLRILSVRERAALHRRLLEQRLETVLPVAMREAGLDMWLVLCQEDDYDPVFQTLMPMDTWAPIVQMLVFSDGEAQAEACAYDGNGGGVQAPAVDHAATPTGQTPGVRRISISRTNTRGLYEQPWTGKDDAEQWVLLRRIIEERNPQRIGINIGNIQWAAGGLTHNLYEQLVEALGPELSARLVSAEPLVTRWLATLTDEEVTVHEHVVNVAHALLAECFSRQAIVPGVTTSEDLEWHYWQRATDLGLQLAFRPFFSIVRSEAAGERLGADDHTIRPGDVVCSDVGIKYLGLNSDHQEAAYVLAPGEMDAPQGLKALMRHANRLQDVYLSQFRRGLTGNELLANMLAEARRQGIPGARIYSHCLGHFLHEPGPLIGLPWEQERCVGRGDVKLEHNYTFTMELCVRDAVPEWGGQEVTLGLEQDVVFTEAGCRVLDGRQTEFHLI